MNVQRCVRHVWISTVVISWNTTTINTVGCLGSIMLHTLPLVCKDCLYLCFVLVAHFFLILFTCCWVWFYGVFIEFVYFSFVFAVFISEFALVVFCLVWQCLFMEFSKEFALSHFGSVWQPSLIELLVDIS